MICPELVSIHDFHSFPYFMVYQTKVQSQIYVFRLCFLGNSCPELEVLRIVAVAGSPINRSSFLLGINPEFILASPIAPTPRLKEFEVRQLTDSFVYGHAPRCEF